MSSPRTTESRQVSWWSVHEFVESAIERAGVESWPLAGTPAWCALNDDEPRKWAALFDAAQHWALRLDALQEASAEASRAVSSVADWRGVAREMQGRRAFRDAHPWAKRVIR